MTGHEIYQRFHRGPGVEPLNSARDAAAALVARYDERQIRLVELSQLMEAAWRGSAAEAAQALPSSLAQVNRSAQKALDTVREALQGQASHFDETRKKLVNVPEKGPTMLPGAPSYVTADIARADDEYKHNAHENVRLYGNYVGASYTNGRTMVNASYPSISALAPPPISVQQPAHPAAQGRGELSHSAKDPAEVHGHQPSRALSDSPIDTTSTAGHSPAPIVRNQPGDPVIGSPADDTVTSRQDWDPDSLAGRRTDVDSAASGSRNSWSPVNDLGGPGAFIGTAAGLNAPEPELERNGKLQAGPRAGVSDHGSRGAAQRATPPARTGGAAGSSEGGWGTAPVRGHQERDVEHTFRYGGFVSLDELLAIDAPYSPAVIGEETDDDEDDSDGGAP